MNTQNRNSDDQHWDVFRYVAEEMTTEEEQQFEVRLLQDQELREQVGKMTMTLASIEQSFAQSSATLNLPKAKTNLRLRKLCVTAAAMIAIAALAISLSWHSENPDQNTESVALAWAEQLELEDSHSPEAIDDLEFVPFEFESDDEADWIAEVVAAVNESADSLN